MNADPVPELPADLKSLEAQLSRLSPTCGNLSRDELMYRAGWEACTAAAMRERLSHPFVTKAAAAAWLWPLTTAGLLVLSATLGIILAIGQPKAEVMYVEKPVQQSNVEQEASAQTATGKFAGRTEVAVHSESWNAGNGPGRLRWRAHDDYLSLRERLLAYGVDVLDTNTAEPPQIPIPAVKDSRYGALINQLRGG